VTAYRFWTLTCDTCGEVSDAGMSRTTYQAIVFARSEGWVRYKEGRLDRDRCGKCAGTHENSPTFGSLVPIRSDTANG